MNPYVTFVETFQNAIKQAAGLAVSGKTEPLKSGPKVLLFSPHPDDECITGLLPLRLFREAGMQIINVPVTFGSNADRQPGRAGELKNACDYLGWEVCPRNGFHCLETEEVVAIIKQARPQIVFVPHAKDWNSRHIETHRLVMNALKEMPDDFSCHIVETEFWGAMENSNLMVEGDVQSVADLVAALSLHTGEVARNPYHLRLPAWMMDNVRRGGEVVFGQGGAAPDFTFATLYRVSRWRNGKIFQSLEKGAALPFTENAGSIFQNRG